MDLFNSLDIVAVAPKSNFSFELVNLVKICSTSTNPKMFVTEEKTNKRSGN